MNAIFYPVASDAEAALRPAQPRAEREREATALATEPVIFVTESFGPTYSSRQEALEANLGRVEERYCTLAQVLVGKKPAKTMRPTYVNGRRWPVPPALPATGWRLIVSYWRPISAVGVAGDGVQARQARRKSKEVLGAQALRSLTEQPLRPVRPQQALDIGLFETRLPEAPHIIVPDE